ncbi:MAG: flavin reductase [Clostridia bacterium]|nr:flavin reductase [Clostridia bacterium]
MGFHEISPEGMTGNAIDMIGREWMLVTAAKDGAREGDPCGGTYNTMTASWGGIGVLWGRPVAFVFIRPERFTYSFAEASDYMTLSFFGGEKKEALAFCGTKSGRDVDKAAACSLTPVFTEEDGGESVYFDEATLVLTLKKLYAAPIDPDRFFDEECLKNYENSGFHKMYVGEIVRVLEK